MHGTCSEICMLLYNSNRLYQPAHQSSTEPRTDSVRKIFQKSLLLVKGTNMRRLPRMTAFRSFGPLSRSKGGQFTTSRSRRYIKEGGINSGEVLSTNRVMTPPLGDGALHPQSTHVSQVRRTRKPQNPEGWPIKFEGWMLSYQA